ncbi:MAG: GNAT family N-acetyltransferase [Deltaproteobacteria bacterium]|nr:GNAT family N-acetyltransferase [Deltaproteobacteria bacterium]
MIHVREFERPPRPLRLWASEVSTGLSFAALREEWTDLLRASAAGPFLSWAWLYPWWRRVAPQVQPRVLVARDEAGKLVGVLPLGESQERRSGVPVTRWGFLGDSWVGSDYLEVLAPRGRERELTGFFAEQLAEKARRFDVLELLDLPRGSPLGEEVLARLASGALRADRAPRAVCPLVKIEGDFEAYLRSVGRSDNLSRRKRWVVAQPGFALERVEEPRAAALALTEFFRLHALRWEKDGGSQGIQGPALRSFHRDATALLAKDGMLRLYTLRLGARAVASVYGIVLGDRFYYYQSGYDPEYARRSVGLVLLGETLADAFRERRVAFELLRGSEPYKFEWANDRRETEAVRVVRRTAGGAAWLATTDGVKAVKAAVRHALGDARWARLQRWRRARRRG